MFHLEEVKRLIREALECSVFVSPRAPGLSFEEIFEVATRLDFKPGEINDAFANMRLKPMQRGSKLLGPDLSTSTNWKFYSPEEPEYRNYEAIDFVFLELSELARNVGTANAEIDRDTLVSRGVDRNIPAHDVEVAIAILLVAETLSEARNGLRFAQAPLYSGSKLPSEQFRTHPVTSRSDTRTQVMSAVKDVIARRTDGRPSHAEPFDAFGSRLVPLGYGAFQLWWTQIVSELRRSDFQSSSISVCVLSAALVEGALTFVVKHARALQIGPFRSTDYDRDPRHWRIDDLVASAASGGPTGILDASVKGRADTLIRTRQRIHAGRVLSDHPSGIPDLRPEEARDARQTAELVVRQVLDWLDRNNRTQ